MIAAQGAVVAGEGVEQRDGFADVGDDGEEQQQAHAREHDDAGDVLDAAGQGGAAGVEEREHEQRGDGDGHFGQVDRPPGDLPQSALLHEGGGDVADHEGERGGVERHDGDVAEGEEPAGHE
ncbi:hypothetical protein FHX50_001670 [Helcobacillus massiliensis]|uniref:Uncharacterized protein n=1 Tax=Helcobacillus massiliensis TaxID=521392 RepID=A0A839QUQ8_9MICO|nr:hypothetical protein [Helcobacillus massiliensis]